VRTARGNDGLTRGHEDGARPGGASPPHAVGDSADLRALRERLALGNQSINVLAMGASVTFMFADLCTEADSHVCSTGPFESDAAFDR
jgi:hypothetical protein